MECKGKWKEYFDELINSCDGSKALISCWGSEKGGGKLKEQKEISIRKIKKVLGKLKLGKASGMDGIKQIF